MEVGDVVKYCFPNHKSLHKASVLGVIIFVGDSSIIIDCEDTARIKVTPKNFKRIELIKHIQYKNKKTLV